MRVLTVLLGCLMALSLASPGAVAGNLAAQCAAAGNDDTVRPYDPSLRDALRTSFQRQFPQAPTDARTIAAQTHIRCMDGRLYVCFTGANLPCGKMNTAPTNKGADAFCRSNPNAPVVPAFAAGHDSIHEYRCRSGKAEVTGRTLFDLDARGFAKRLWTPLD
ncbi:MAG TPA: hypothetical protein VHO91_07410 [Rhodopila sp.]|nr:hypothetical protein [Rhodopila sp.]